MPWRQENDMRHEDGTNENKYKNFQNKIVENVKIHKPYLVIDNKELIIKNF